MRFTARSTATTIVVDLPARADASPTFVALTPAGGSAQASTNATLDSVSTTLSAAPAAGATSVAVTSATGIIAGRKYLVGGPESVGGERVTVKSVSGTTITLVRPLRYAKASGAAFQSTRVECAVTSGAVSSYGRHYRVVISWAVSTVAQPSLDVPFDVVRYMPLTTLSLDDVTDLDPMLLKRLPAGLWAPARIDRAWEILLRRIASKKCPGALIGAIDLTIPHGYMFRALLAETAGAEFEAYRTLMVERYASELESVLSSAAFDDDMDGKPEAHEQWFRSIDVIRG
jgi:hypothetical protein